MKEIAELVTKVSDKMNYFGFLRVLLQLCLLCQEYFEYS